MKKITRIQWHNHGKKIASDSYDDIMDLLHSSASGSIWYIYVDENFNEISIEQQANLTCLINQYVLVGNDLVYIKGSGCVVGVNTDRQGE